MKKNIALLSIGLTAAAVAAPDPFKEFPENIGIFPL